MRSHRTVFGMLPILLLAAACDSPTDLRTATVGSRTSLRIHGPAFINGAGTYSWEAILPDGGVADGYEWRATWIDVQRPAVVSNERVLSLVVNDERGRIAIDLIVKVAGATSHASTLVGDCPRPPYEEEGLIACERF